MGREARAGRQPTINAAPGGEFAAHHRPCPHQRPFYSAGIFLLKLAYLKFLILH